MKIPRLNFTLLEVIYWPEEDQIMVKVLGINTRSLLLIDYDLGVLSIHVLFFKIKDRLSKGLW